MSMNNPEEITLGLRILTNAEKAYAWRKSILEKSSKMTLSKEQRDLISDVIESFNNPNIFDKSIKSKDTRKLLSDRAKSLFSDLDYFTVFSRLGDRDKLIRSIEVYQQRIKNNKDISSENNNLLHRKTRDDNEPTITSPVSDTGGGVTCTCASNYYCYVNAYLNGVCYWDENLCYTDGGERSGCGYTGADPCDGQCG